MVLTVFQREVGGHEDCWVRGSCPWILRQQRHFIALWISPLAGLHEVALPAPYQGAIEC